MKLQHRILLAQIPALLVLLALVVFGVRAVDELGDGASVILEHNYRSILASKRMKGSIERLDSAAILAVAGEEARAQERVQAHRPAFEAELAMAEGNLTESGEAEIAAALRRSWTDNQRALDALLAAEPQAARDLYFQAVVSSFDKTRDLADRMLALNQDAMLRKRDAAQATAARLRRRVVLSGLLAVLVAVGLGGWVARRVTEPVRDLAEGVRRIGEGDLDHRLAEQGQDELGELAREFNRMADNLRAYRRSSLGELAQAQQSSQAAIESLLDPVLIFSTRGELRGANTAARGALGLAADAADLSGADAQVQAAVAKAQAHVFAGRGPFLPADFSAVIPLSRPEGTRALLPRATPIYDALTEELAGMTVVLQDVTRLRRLDELKSDLVHTVAHELRTPLTSLGMAVHLCLDERVAGPLDSKRADLLAAAREDVERMRTLVEDLLDLARLQEGEVLFRREPTSPAHLIRAAAAGQADAARDRGVAVQEGPHDEGLAPVAVDAERMGVVLANLLSNAIRHTPPGGRVQVRARGRGKGRLRIEVEDTGPGVPPEHRERIFEKFYQVPGTEAGGSGLGLSIAREIVQGHGGQLGVQGGAGGGALFFVELPVV